NARGCRSAGDDRPQRTQSRACPPCDSRAEPRGRNVDHGSGCAHRGRTQSLGAVAPDGTRVRTRDGRTRVRPRTLVGPVRSDRALLLYVGASNSDRSQRAARIDVNTGAIESLRLAPSDDLPPLDHPALVRCGREPWLVAEILVSEGNDAGTSPRESAVIALPF